MKSCKETRHQKNNVPLTEQNVLIRKLAIKININNSSFNKKNTQKTLLLAKMTFRQIYTDLRHAVIKNQHAETILALMYSKKERNYIGSTFHKITGKTFSSLLKMCPSQLFGDKYFLYLLEEIATCIRTIMIECF